MANCPSCSTAVPESSRFCLACGASIANDVSVTQTVASSTPHTPSAPSRTASLRTSTTGLRSTTGSRFLPGALIAGRYRIIALLGKGGMGEVYRADDLTLDQQVALKFLPESFAANAGWVERFRNEVRVARQVSHPNVCRVYDVGEVEGHLFLSMEYVDGEDLASLLRRIGRLPSDKALEIARGLCAGLAAAHDKGILHRDLKPGNVMIDGRGHVLLTDFGLAGLATEMEGLEVRNGTPAYMAPEQLSGKEVTVRSDIYSLGLVLYEIFTGKRPFEASTLAELVRMRAETSPTTPSTLVYDMDPVIERVILRCLATNPASRPGSALAVAAALPGGDPLAAALAAGETPSPEMVAAAGEGTGLSLRAAVPLVLCTLAALVGVAILQNRGSALQRLEPRYSPEVMTQKARDIVQRAGYGGTAADEAGGYEWQTWYLDYVVQHEKPKPDWDKALRQRAPILRYWYRQSPYPMTGMEFHDDHLTPGIVEENDPPRFYSGMVNISLDSQGRLFSFEVIPPHKLEPITQPPPTPDWAPLFAAAELDPAKLQPAEPLWTFQATPDFRTAWTGTWPGTSFPLRVEAASLRGKPIAFVAFGPWTKPWRMPPKEEGANNRGAILVLLGISIVTTVAVWLFSRTNSVRGQGDQRGASRLGTFVFVVQMGMWICRAHFGSLDGVFGTCLLAVVTSLAYSYIVRMIYLALEPWVRRRWPHTLISWANLLGHRIRDPIVGRDVLVGLAIGISWGLINQVARLLTPGAWPELARDDLLLGARDTVGSWLIHIPGSIRDTLVFFLLVFVLRLVLRKQWLAGAGFVLIFTGLQFFSHGSNTGDIISALIVYTLIAFSVLRFGLLTLGVALFTAGVMGGVPVTASPSDWYFGSAMFMLATLAALAVWSFFVSIGGQKLLKENLLD